MMTKKYEQRPEGYSSRVDSEGLNTKESDGGCRILEEIQEDLDSLRSMLQRSFDI